MSEIAIKRIEAEKQNKTGNLDLRGLGLTTLPEELQALHWLKELKLNHNDIQDIQPLSKITNLQSLNLDRNDIHDLYPLETLTQLRSLDLDSNQIKNLQPLNKLTRLDSLSVYNNLIQDITPLDKFSRLLGGHRRNHTLPHLKTSGRHHTLQRHGSCPKGDGQTRFQNR